MIAAELFSILMVFVRFFLNSWVVEQSFPVASNEGVSGPRPHAPERSTPFVATLAIDLLCREQRSGWSTELRIRSHCGIPLAGCVKVRKRRAEVKLKGSEFALVSQYGQRTKLNRGVVVHKFRHWHR